MAGLQHHFFLKFTDNPENYILKKILSSSVESSHSLVPSLAFGKKYEPVARQQYFEKHKKITQEFKSRSMWFVC